MIEDEPKFTPGPWRKKGKRVFWQKPEPDLPKDNLFNGLVCICATTEDNPPEVIEEVCANAALIAQSPAMYAELDGTADFLRVLADVLEETMKHDSRKEYAAAVLRVAVSMRKRTDGIDALLRKAREEAK